MPQRTNDFQELVEIIHKLFAPAGATVTPSAMIDGREVDVFIEYELKGVPVKVAVEAKDLSRAIDLTAVEQYIGKYNTPGGIQVDKVIIIGKSFVRTAPKRVEKLSFIELHTLKSLEESRIGLFTKKLEEKGDWWIGNGSPRNVKLSLFGDSEKKLNDAYLRGLIKARPSREKVGNPIAWATYLVNRYLGDEVLRIYSENAGEQVHVTAELIFANHTIETKSFRSISLRKIVFDFNKTAKMPQMSTQLHELSTGSRESKKIVQQIGLGKNSKLRIAYEDAETPPRIQVQGIPNTVRYINFQLDFDTVLAKAKRDAPIKK